MRKKDLFVQSDLILVLIIYSFLAFFSISYHHYTLGIDGISYLTIAEKYVHGDWYNALNGYWSPLYSWLIVPLLFFGYDPSYAPYITRMVSFIAGFFTIIGLNRLGYIFNIDKPIKRILLVTSIPMVLFYSIFYDTPDVLVVCLLVYYFSIIFKENYSYKWINGVLCGFLGGLAFFSKTYMFPFFLVHFLFFNFLYYFKALKINKDGVKRNLILGLVIFLVISGIWIGTLSSKYDKLTIGTTTEYNHAIIGPEYHNHPVYFVGLIKPPNPRATSTWEEPSLVKLNDWNPLQSWENFEYQLKIIWRNLYLTVIILEYYSILSLAILIISLYFILKPNTKKCFKDKLIYLLITIFIYSLGYLLIFIQDRYLWTIIILSMLCGFYLVSSLYENKILSLKFRNIFLVLLMFSFIFAPAYEFFIYPNTDSDFYVLSKTLQNDYKIHGNIASNDLWEKTNQISYHLDSNYYGLPKNSDNFNELQNQLEANNIDYYFVWGDSNNVHLVNYNEITNGKIQGLKIYSWTKRIN